MRRKHNPAKLKGIQRLPKKMADGTVKIYLYHRATGIRLDPDNLASSYAAAEKRRLIRGEENLTTLIRLFDSSTYFSGLSTDHKREYIWKLRRIEVRWGDVPKATFDDADDADEFAGDALAWHQDMGKTSLRSADNLMSCLCRVLSFAKEQRKIKFHPLPTFKRLYKSDRSDKTWTDELQVAFMRAARPSMRTAMILARNTAMRAADIRKFPWTRYDGQRVQIRSQKTGKLLWIPATRELRAHLDGLTRDGALVMLTANKKAYTKRYFNEHWRADCDALDSASLATVGPNINFDKTADLNFHDNRGTAATLLAEIGATAPEIAEALTWTVDKAQRVIDKYLARRGVLAANAITRLEDHRDQKARRGQGE